MKKSGTEAKPSQITDAYWIFASRRAPGYPLSTARSGKWLLFVPHEQVDEVWSKVQVALEEGKLGDFAKVSTMRPNANASDPQNHVICVYTYDHEDLDDVMRVRQALREIGFLSKIPYKTDEATLAGKYRVRGDRRVSKYYC